MGGGPWWFGAHEWIKLGGDMGSGELGRGNGEGEVERGKGTLHKQGPFINRGPS